MTLLQYKFKGYDQWIQIRKGEFFKAGCSCPDFLFRRVCSGKKDDLCKHLQLLIKGLDWETIKEIHEHGKKEKNIPAGYD